MSVTFEELPYHEEQALLFAEKHGIIEYTVEGNTMIWVESYPHEGKFEHRLNLDTNEESVKRTELPDYLKGVDD